MSVTPAPSTAAVFPASFGQQRLWFLDRLEPGGTAYVLPLVVRLSGPLAVDALHNALEALIERHEILRTTFAESDGEVHQVVTPSGRFEFDQIDVAGAADPEAAAREAAARILATPFNLAAGPLFRAALVRLAPDEHLLVLALHHIAGDGWSIGVLKRDLAELYSAELDGRSPELPELPVQYGDFAAWQRDWLTGARYERQLEHWRERLAGAPPLLALPTDRPRPAVQSLAGAHRRRRMPRSTVERLERLGRSEDATLFMTLLAGYAVLLGHYSERDDIVVGTPIAGRTRAEIESLVGFFANTLALRADLSGAPTFRELLQRIREVALDAFEHQEMPFEKLVAELSPERRLAHAPLFQTLFALQHAEGRPLALPGVRATPVELERATSKWDLAFFALQDDEGLRVSCEYDTDLFDATTVDRMLAHYEMVLEGVLADPDRPVWELELVTPDEAAAVEYGGPPASSQGNVLEPIVGQASAAPDAVAVTFAAERITYGELLAKARAGAARLRDRGVGPDVPVAVCVERSPDLVVALMSVLMAGGAYAPLDPSHPPARLQAQLEDLAPRLAITGSGNAEGLGPAVDVLSVSDLWSGSAPPPADFAEPAADQLAYVLFTSGSTGRPKGVAMEHGVLANLVAWQVASWGERKPARTLQFASATFDVSFQEIACTLVAGGTLVMADDATRRDPEALAALLDDERIERAFLPFVALDQLAEAARRADRVPRALREVITAGEALRVTPAIRWLFEALDGAVLRNQYGPTESHVVTEYVLAGDPAAWPLLPPIGRPIPGARIQLLNPSGGRVPVGVAGELHIGGPVLARGYLGRPELTAERFVDRDGSRWYRTGDLARTRADGELEFVGRSDDQVKIRGFRVEPSEVEARLRAHPDVRDAVVLARCDNGAPPRLVAYVVGDRTIEAATLRSFARQVLPDHMVPATVVELDAFPLNAHGKVDRLALPAPSAAAPSTGAVRDGVERGIAEIWQRLLGTTAPIGPHDDFFSLGGHSLLAVRLFADIEHELGVRLPLSTLFQGATVAELAAALRHERVSSQRWSSLVALRAEGTRPPLFVLALGDGDVLQYRQLVEHLGPDQPVYGLRAPSLDGSMSPFGTIEEMAAHYLSELRAFAPGGGHLLCGYCFGGVVAYEMAHQLAQDGEDPPFLSMIDSTPFGRYPATRTRAAGARSRFAERRGPDTARREWVGRRAANLHNKVGLAAFDFLAPAGRKPRGVSRPWPLHPLASTRAKRRYLTPVSDARIVYFGVQSEAGADYVRRWMPLARGGVEFHAVEGADVDHFSIMKAPYVGRIAHELRQAIDEHLAGNEE